MNTLENSRPRVPVRKGDGILLVRLGAVGDVVRTLPSLARLRESHPEARLGWVVEASSAPLLPRLPWLDRAILFPRSDLKPARLLSRGGEVLAALRHFISQIRDFAPQVALDFQGTTKSALISLLSGASWRIGFDRSASREGSSIFSNLRVRPSSPRLNRIHKNLELLNPLGTKEKPLTFPFPSVNPSHKVRKFVDSLGEVPRVALHPGTSRRQDHKRWPLEHYARLLQLLAHEQKTAPIITWGPGEEDLVGQIQAAAPGLAAVPPPTDLLEMRELIGSCRVFVGGDTGPMHLAWTQGVPVVALFGATDPLINGPLGKAHRILAPAWGSQSPSPRRGDAAVMRTITPESVLEAIQAVLRGSAAVAPVSSMSQDPLGDQRRGEGRRIR